MPADAVPQQVAVVVVVVVGRQSLVALGAVQPVHFCRPAVAEPPLAQTGLDVQHSGLGQLSAADQQQTVAQVAPEQQVVAQVVPEQQAVHEQHAVAQVVPEEQVVAQAVHKQQAVAQVVPEQLAVALVLVPQHDARQVVALVARHLPKNMEQKININV